MVKSETGIFSPLGRGVPLGELSNYAQPVAIESAERRALLGSGCGCQTRTPHNHRLRIIAVMRGCTKPQELDPYRQRECGAEGGRNPVRRRVVQKTGCGREKLSGRTAAGTVRSQNPGNRHTHASRLGQQQIQSLAAWFVLTHALYIPLGEEVLLSK